MQHLIIYKLMLDSQGSTKLLFRKRENAYLVSSSCVFSIKRFPTSLPIPGGEGGGRKVEKIIIMRAMQILTHIFWPKKKLFPF